MDATIVFAQLPQVILPWYLENRRDLPWRQDTDPYHVWVSEIMLQQTRVEAVKGYYSRFLSSLPAVKDLAKADDQLLYKLWEGLGYYSRIRNMKKAAVIITEKFDGSFPRDYKTVLSLPGIGPYTAGAICSIAYDLKTPAVDGNVLRVASRLLGDATPIDKPEFRNRVQKALVSVYPKQAGAFTQALMELGATICGPNRKPDCQHCPCSGFCKGHLSGTAETLPNKTPKAGRRVEDITVYIIECDGCYALEQRPAKGLLASMWQFPNTNGKISPQEAIAKVEKKGVNISEILMKMEKKHIFTHVEWSMCGIYLTAREKTGDYTWVSREQIRAEIALPTAFRQFWEEIDYV